MVFWTRGFAYPSPDISLLPTWYFLVYFGEAQWGSAGLSLFPFLAV